MCSFLPALRPAQVAECHPGGHVDLPLANMGLCDESACRGHSQTCVWAAFLSLELLLGREDCRLVSVRLMA